MTLLAYFVTTISVITATYFLMDAYSKYKTRYVEFAFQIERYKSLLIDPQRILQIIFLDFRKKAFEYIEHDVWFNIVTYVSNSDDGARSYHHKNPWLECFILPLDLKLPSEVSGNFQSAHIKFELAPREFIEQVERFSELLKTRDMCKLLFKWAVSSIDEDQRYPKLEFWISLQAAIQDIMQSEKHSGTGSAIQTHIAKNIDLIQLSLQRFCESRMENSLSSVANQLQKFLQRSINDKELQTSETSK